VSGSNASARARLAAFFRRSSRQAWADERADAVIAAAATTLRLWGADGGELDFDALAADIAAEARLALTLEVRDFRRLVVAPVISFQTVKRSAMTCR
jgi:hypothetical protein